MSVGTEHVTRALTLGSGRFPHTTRIPRTLPAGKTSPAGNLVPTPPGQDGAGRAR